MTLSPLILAAALSATAAKTGQMSPTSDVSSNRVKATGSTTYRSNAARAEDRLSLLEFIPSSAHTSIRQRDAESQSDLSDYINLAISTYASSANPNAVLYCPRGKYRHEKPILLQSHVTIRGDAGAKHLSGSPGCEFAFYGTTGPSVLTAQDAHTDWSQSHVEDVSFVNYVSTTADGFRMRNPQNHAALQRVLISGFQGRGLYVYEDPARVAGAGTTPGVYDLDSVFVVSGATPIEIQAGIQSAVIKNFKVDTGPGSTVGVLISKAPSATAQGATVTFIGGTVEIPSTTGDIHGIEWSVDSPISMLGTGVQRNNDLPSTKAAFYYSGTVRKIPTWTCLNCSSWNNARLYWFNGADLKPAAQSRTVAESFSWDRASHDTEFVFMAESLGTGATNATIPYGGNVNSGTQGIPFHRPGTIVGVTARYSCPITNGTLVVKPVLAGSATPTVTLSSADADQSDEFDYILGDAINGAWFHGSTGSVLTMQYTTSSDFAPTGCHLIATTGVRFR